MNTIVKFGMMEYTTLNGFALTGKGGEMMDIRDVDGLWCDDITFCQEWCALKDCPRNSVNIRDKNVPHSFSVGIPADCPMPDQKKIESIFFGKPID